MNAIAQAVTGFHHRDSCQSRAVHVGFVADKMAQGQVVI